MIEVLYSLVGVVVAIGYLTQIIKLIKTTLPCHDISIFSWSIFAYASFISLLYSLYGQEIYDINFVIVNSINATCIAMVICITVYKRRKYRIIPALIVVPICSDEDDLPVAPIEPLLEPLPDQAENLAA